MSQRAFVSCDAGEPQRRCGLDGVRHVFGLCDGACSGPAAGGAELDEDLDRAVGVGIGAGADARGVQGGVHLGDGVHRVGPAGEGEVRVGGQLGGDPRQARRVDERVGQHEALDAEGAGHAELREVGERDADGAGVELGLPERGGHRGLAVRGEDDAGLAAPGRHGAQVVVEGAGVESEERRAEVGEVRGRGDISLRGPSPGLRRQRFEAPVEVFVAERGHGGAVDAGPRGADGRTSGGPYGASAAWWIALCATLVAYVALRF